MADHTDEQQQTGEDSRKAGAFQLSQEPVTQSEEEIAVHKFEVAPEPVTVAHVATPACVTSASSRRLTTRNTFS